MALTDKQIQALRPSDGRITKRSDGGGLSIGVELCLQIGGTFPRRITSRGPWRSRLRRAVRVTEAVLEDLAKLEPLAPFHQPHNLAPIRAIMQLAPPIPQIACFDTAFIEPNQISPRRSPFRAAAPKRASAGTGFTDFPMNILSPG
jgi:hypothetical protein